jgi:hypothetical protein
MFIINHFLVIYSENICCFVSDLGEDYYDIIFAEITFITVK